MTRWKDNCSLRLHLHREDPRDCFADLCSMDAVQCQRELRLHQTIWNASVVALALDCDDAVFVGLLPQMLLCGGELKLALLADVVLHQVLEALEDPRPE